MGKAEKRGGIVDHLKSMGSQTDQNYGLARAAQSGAPNQRDYSIGTANNDYDQAAKLSVYGGVMLGALGYDYVGTEQVPSSGIVDTGDYNRPRLILNNNSSNTLKVLLPIYKSGQEVWISASIGQSFTIQNTSGNGDETTGNIELLQATDYSMSGNDWLCFIYDPNDEKFHQVSAGVNDVGAGSSGEVFTWTNNHDAAGFSLLQTGQVSFNASGTNDARITASAAGLDFVIDSADDYDFFVGSFNAFQINSSSLQFVKDDGVTAITISRTSGTMNFHNLGAGIINCPALEMDGDIDLAGDISLRTDDKIEFDSPTAITDNFIKCDSLGHMEYSLGDSNKRHEFFCGSEFFRIDGNTSEISSFVKLNLNSNLIQNCDGITNSSAGGLNLNSPAATSLADNLGLFIASDSTTSTWQTLRTITPFLDDTYDLGTSSLQFRNIYIDGTAFIDTLDNSGDIKLGTDLDIDTGATIDFHDVSSTSKSAGSAAALPATPQGYFIAKYRGLTRYIPYYSA
jgi:hypothetical protein